MKTTITFIAFLLFTVYQSTSQVIHVPVDEPTIQAGIDAANENDTVLVAQGEYFENINFKGKNIVLCSNFAFTNDLNDVISTIINGSNPIYPDTGSCVLIVSGEDSTCVLQGFTLTGGTGTRWEDEHGPGYWYTEGGGILIQYSSPVIRDNIITYNQAVYAPSGTVSAGGGGIRCGDGNPRILNNIISYNHGLYGGGIVMNYSGAVIKNNMIIGNSGGEDFGGGGLWFLRNGDKPLIVENNTIIDNSSAMGGGGIRLLYAPADLTNNIIWGNNANYGAQIQGSSGEVTYCCVEGGFDGEGNIDSDPFFISDSYILDDNSPCIDAGNAGASFNDPEDQMNPGSALYPAKGTLHADMGVYGGPGSVSMPDVITRITNFNDITGDMEINVFPNPAISKISIEIIHSSQSPLLIEIYDSNSTMVQRIDEKNTYNDGSLTETDISGLSSGMYFVKVRSENKIKVRKFIKL